MTYRDLVKASLGLLARRPRSVKEITNYLSKKTSDQALINQTLEYLQHNKLINDDSFAEWLIESRSRAHPKGILKLKAELKSKGINFTPEVNEIELAQKALLKKFKTTHPTPKSIKDKNQIINFLKFRGFSWSTIERVLKIEYNGEDVNE
jgi:SOS response regulatory protein OraA/RecX